MAEDIPPIVLRELHREASKISEAAEEALRHYVSGDIQTACDVASLSRYPIDHTLKAWEGVMQAFSDRGVKPGEGK